jgi:HNH endonuclease
VQHGGETTESNLALACPHCNFHKGPNLTGIDPITGEIEPLFNPRRHTWDVHFQLQADKIYGLTPQGRTTVRVLAFNDDEQIELRRMFHD